MVAMVAMVASEVPRETSAALVVRAASPEPGGMVAKVEMLVQEQAAATAVEASVGTLFCPQIVMVRTVAKVAMPARRVSVKTVIHLKIRATVPLVATPVTAGLAGTSPAQIKMVALVATAAVAVAHPVLPPLAMAA
jgi:hypothetical protein